MKRNIGKELLGAIRDIKRSKGKRIIIETLEDVKEIRSNLDLSQISFATLLGVSVRTLQDWEQGRRHPRGPALSLLKIAAEYPEIFTHSRAS